MMQGYRLPREVGESLSLEILHGDLPVCISAHGDVALMDTASGQVGWVS